MKKAIVLGGTNPHIELIKNLKKRGYYTILIDYYENPPAKVFADEHIQESTLDKDLVLEIAKKEQVDLVISTCIDQANATACFVAEKLHLPAPYDYKTSIIVTNKIQMKNLMKEIGIPTSRYMSIYSIDGLEKLDLKFPLVIKPSDTTGSKGVVKVNNIDELSIAFNEAKSLSREKMVIVEEFVQGIEFQVDYYINNHQPHRLMIRRKRKKELISEFVLQANGSIVSPISNAEIESKLDRIASKIVSMLDIRNSSLFIQCIINKTNVNVLEFATRVGGGLSYSMIRKITGFDILDATVDSFLGNEVKIDIKEIDKYYATHLFYSKPGIFGSINGLEQAKEDNENYEHYLFKTRGMAIGGKQTSGDRVAAVFIEGKTLKEVEDKLESIIDKVNIYDIDGNILTEKRD